MTREMWNAMPDGWSVDYSEYVHEGDFDCDPTISDDDENAPMVPYHWDAETGGWYVWRITNPEDLMYAYNRYTWYGEDEHRPTNGGTVAQMVRCFL